MSPLDALWHFLNFLAPAWCVAALLALACKLLWRGQVKGQAWHRLWLWGAVGGSLGSILALLLLGHEGKMLGYGLMLLGVSLPQWWLAFRPRR